jgi:hypothetical protein
MLCFTSANGAPIMCAIIFAAQTMKNEYSVSFDPFVELIGEEHEIEKNIGEGKVYPMGPEFNLNGKNVPCLCCCSESGSITRKLLADS